MVAPLGRPVALTLEPPLYLPLGGGGRWLAGEGTVVGCGGTAVNGETVVVGGGSAVVGWFDDVGGMVCFVFIWVPASAGMTDGLRE